MAKIIIDRQIARFRKRKGITQEQLATALNVSNQAVSKWESAQCCPDIALLPEIAAFFGVTVDELLGVSGAKDETARLAEHLIEMSVLSWKSGLISLVEYTERAVRFPFLKTAVNITIGGGYSYEMTEEILKAAAGEDQTARLISDCMLLLIKGAHPTALIQILENRLLPREIAALKLSRPDFFPTRADFYVDIRGKKPLSEKTALLEKILSHSDIISNTKLYYAVSDELFTALYGSSEQVIRVISDTLDQNGVRRLAWDFKLLPAPPEEKITECQQTVFAKIGGMLRAW